MEDNKEQMEPKNAQKNVHDAQIIVHEKNSIGIAVDGYACGGRRHYPLFEKLLA